MVLLVFIGNYFNQVEFMKKKKLEIKSRSLVTPLLYFVYLVVVWSFYRMDFKFSDTLEELYIKPVIWLLPFLYIIPKGKLKAADFGLTLKNLFPSLYLSVALGVGFAVLAFISNIVKHGGVNFQANIGTMFIGSALALSFVTAFTEELVFRGYLLNAFVRKYPQEISVVATTTLWTLVHAPISYFVWKMTGLQIAVYLGLTFVYGLGASILYLKTKNIASSIFLHVLWEWPIILFR